MSFRYTLLPILASTAWISISEFVRNQFLIQSDWVSHYQAMGLTFPAAPVNGAVWGVWSTAFATVIFILMTKFTLAQTVALSWVIGFLLMWLVIGNLGVLPWSILPVALPLSVVEVFVAAWIIQKLSKQP